LVERLRIAGIPFQQQTRDIELVGQADLLSSILTPQSLILNMVASV
jgi:hypothetical protein